MPRYFLHLAYRGAPYHGWQRQPEVMTVQQVIEDALSIILRNPTPIVGAGRTDTGVNARMMIAHFDSAEPLEERAMRILNGLSRLCGRDIAFYSLRRVADDAHARFDAISRTYHYYAVTRPTPFAHELTWRAPAGIHWDGMNRAAQLLLATDDFTSFSKLHTDTKTNICHVTEALWKPWGDDGGMVFRITADRFLRNMVRAVVGTLVEVGRGKMDIAGFKRVIEAHDRCAAGTSMPAGALFLEEVRYPYAAI